MPNLSWAPDNSRVGKLIGKFFETNINIEVLSDSLVLFFQLWASKQCDWLNFWSLLSTVQALILRSLLVQVIQPIFFCQTFFIWHFHILSIWPDIKAILINSWTSIFLLTCKKYTYCEPRQTCQAGFLGWNCSGRIQFQIKTSEFRYVHAS